ncbi:MBL fold metallo-hydrolase [Aestuariivirga sp.]|uniref:MBL fold metallo-hydrolase n=1 Tax=Aestuariivirga sp. TaxID=2650926 RepID=UPI0039E5EB9C
MTLNFDRSFDVTPGHSMQLSPLVRRVLCNNPSPFTFKGTNSFIVGQGEVAVIDPGPEDEAHLGALLEAVKGERVKAILVTHSHADHSPLALRLQEKTQAPIYGFGPLAAREADGPRLDASIDHGFMPDRRLAHGAVVKGAGWTLEALHTPGHMSNHLCFALKEENTLFAGDHVMAWATSVIAPPDGDMADYMRALRLLLARSEELYHPAHGPSSVNGRSLVRGYIAHRIMREAAILGRIREGDRSIAKIVAALYADVDPRLHAAAAQSVSAHIAHLKQQGLVRGEDGYLSAA